MKTRGFNLYDHKGLWGRGSNLRGLLNRAKVAGILNYIVHPTLNDIPDKRMITTAHNWLLDCDSNT